MPLIGNTSYFGKAVISVGVFIAERCIDSLCDQRRADHVCEADNWKWMKNSVSTYAPQVLKRRITSGTALSSVLSGMPKRDNILIW